MAEEKRRVKVVIDSETQKKLDEAEAKLEEEITKRQEAEEKVTEFVAEKEKEALEKFTTDKADILKLCKDSGLDQEKIDEVDTMLDSPTKLDVTKTFVNMFLKAIKVDDKTTGKSKPPTKGKASMTPPPDGKPDVEAQKQLIREQYAILRNPKATIQEKKKADAQIDRFWDSLRKNPTWEKLRKAKKLGTESGKGLYNVSVSSCPKCNAENSSPIGSRTATCQSCGHVYQI